MTKDEALTMALEAADELAWMLTCGYEVGREGPPRVHRLISKIREFAEQPPLNEQEPVAGMVLVPYEPCFEMQEQGSRTSNYDLSQSRAKRVYQAMIDMHQVLEEKEPSDEWFQLNAGYTSPPQPQQEPIGDDWMPCMKLPVIVHVRQQRKGETHVSTREGITPVKPDDLIMRGVSGEEYPIGMAIFEQTYSLDTSPPAQRTWVGLTAKEVADLVVYPMNPTADVVKAIEAKLKEKNNAA